MGHRNKLLHLIEIYELLLEGRQTFYSLRQSVHIGYDSLKSILDFLLNNDYIVEIIRDDTRYYEYTESLVELFDGPLYQGIKDLEDI